NALSGVTIGKTISGKNAGFYGVSVSGSAQNYDFNLVGGLTIKKANATVTATSKTLTYNGFNQSVSGFTVKGLVGGEKASVLSDVSAGVSGKDVGRYVAVASGTDDNYNLSFVNGTLTITQASAKVIANSKTVSYTGALQTVSGFTVQGLVGNDTASVLTGVSTTGGSGINVGKYSLIASGSDKNYKLTFVKGALTIQR
ncbi:MAG: hypothetical protein EBR59_08675, partial [Methylococcaceae bacterium]|nr:hypothetical protein [Methylococcaceae bacterium]